MNKKFCVNIQDTNHVELTVSQQQQMHLSEVEIRLDFPQKQKSVFHKPKLF